MSPDKRRRSIVTTHVEFNRSVDREVLGQIADLNLRGLQALLALRSAGFSGLPAPLLQFDELGADSDIWQRLGRTPYLLFEWSPLIDWRVHEPLCGWRQQAVWTDFARLAAYASAEICRLRRVAAPLLLGMSAGQCDEWAKLALPEVDLRAQQAGQQLGLRWSSDVRFWQRRFQAAASPTDEAALWRNTLEGVQRLAVLGRSGV